MTDSMVMTKKSSRLSRPRAVWLTYRTRPLLWAFAVGFGVVLVLFVLQFRNFQRRATQSAVPLSPSPMPLQWVSSVPPNPDLDWNNVKSLWISGLADCRPLWTAGSIPQLESLSIMDDVTDQQMAGLCELYNLKSLTLYSVSSLTADGFRSLSTEVDLEYLQIINMHPVHNIARLEWPPNLRTLICDDALGTPLNRLIEWQQLKKLTCLSARLILLDRYAPADQLETLRAYPSLTRLFVMDLGQTPASWLTRRLPWSPDREFPGAEFVQAALPNLRVRPTSFDPVRGELAAWIFVGGLLVVFMFIVQLMSQFLLPASSWMPRFAWWHLEPLVGIYAVTAFVSLFLYLLAGCNGFVATALCGSSAFVISAAVKSTRSTKGFTHPAAWMPVATIPITGIVFLVIFFGSEWDWFLRGQYRWLNLVFLVGSIWGGGYVVKWLTRLRHEIEEAHCGALSLSPFDPAGMEFLRTHRTESLEKQGTALTTIERKFDVYVDRLIERFRHRKEQSDGATRLMGIIVGANTSQQRVVSFMTCLVLIIGIMMFLHVTSFADHSFTTTFALISFGGMITNISPFSSFVLIQQSLPFQEMGLLRPFSRHDWARSWFQWVAYESFCGLLVWITLILAMIGSGIFTGFSVVDAALHFTMMIGLMGLLTAVGLYTITLRSTTFVIMIGVITFFVATQCVGFSLLPVFLHSRQSIVPAVSGEWTIDEWFTLIMIPAIIVVYLLAIVGFRVAWRRWQNWEIGTIS